MSDFPDLDVMDEVYKRLDRVKEYRGKPAALSFAARQVALARLQTGEIKNPAERVTAFKAVLGNELKGHFATSKAASQDERIAALKAILGDDLAAELLNQANYKSRIVDDPAVGRALDQAAQANVSGDDIAAAVLSLAQRTGYKTRLKQGPPDVIDQAIEAIRRAATELAKTHGDQDVATYLQSVARQLSPASGSMGMTMTDTGTTKATRPRDGFMAAVEGIMNGSIEITDLRPSGR